MKRPGLIFLVWKNVTQRPFRNVILAACAAAVAGMLVAAELIERSSRKGLELGIERIGADLVAVPRGLEGEVMQSYMTGDPALFYMDASLEEKILNFEWVEKTSPQLYIKSLSGASCCSQWDVFLIGFNPKTDFTVRPWLSRNRDVKVGSDDVLAGAAFDFEVGTELMFYGHRFRVAGTLDPTGMGLDTSVFIPIETAYLMAGESTTKAEQALEISPETVSAILIKLKPEREGGIPGWKAAYDLEMAIDDISIIQPEDIATNTQQNLAATLKTLHSASYALWPVTALLIGLVFAMAVNERRRDIGLLRAVGASQRFVFRLIIAEALLLAGVGAAVGVAAATGLVIGFSRLIALKLETPFYLPEAGEIAVIEGVALLLALLTGAVAAMLPAIQSSGREPYELIRRDE